MTRWAFGTQRYVELCHCTDSYSSGSDLLVKARTSFRRGITEWSSSWRCELLMYPSLVCISSKAMVGFFCSVLNNSPSIFCRQTQYMLRMFSVRHPGFYNGPLFSGCSPLFCLSHVKVFLEAEPPKMCQSCLYYLYLLC
jgi:hypothetical protein